MTRAALAVLGRPRLWLPAARALWRLRRRGALGPSPEWLTWRLHTAYGTERTPEPADVTAWLEWSAAFEKAR